MPNLEPTVSELAAREAALRASIVGPGYPDARPWSAPMPAAEPARRISNFPQGVGGSPVSTVDFHPSPLVEEEKPRVLLIDLEAKTIHTSFGTYDVADDMLAPVAFTAFHILKVVFERKLDEVAAFHGIANLLGGAAPAPPPTPAAPTGPATAPVAATMAAPTAAAGGEFDDEDDDADPPHPDPKPVRKPRQKVKK